MRKFGNNGKNEVAIMPINLSVLSYIKTESRPRSNVNITFKQNRKFYIIRNGKSQFKFESDAEGILNVELDFL